MLRNRLRNMIASLATYFLVVASRAQAAMALIFRLGVQIILPVDTPGRRSKFKSMLNTHDGLILPIFHALRELALIENYLFRITSY